jgi:hypothetical protein
MGLPVARLLERAGKPEPLRARDDRAQHEWVRVRALTSGHQVPGPGSRS